MSRVLSDPEALGELAAALRACRAAMRDGEAAVRDRLIVGLHESWSDARYDAFSANLLQDLDVIRGLNDLDMEHLEQRLYSLRERLLRYHEETAAHGQQTIQPSAPQIGSQVAEYENAIRSGRFTLGERDVKRQVGVAAIAAPQQDQNFWNHHGNTKETYIALAATLAEITPLIRQGHSLTGLAQNDRYRQAIDAFWSRSDPIRVTQFRDIYIVEAGRHRVAAVLEYGRSDFLGCLVTAMIPGA